MKKNKKIILFIIIMISIVFGKMIVYADVTEEDISIIKNPDRGFYKEIQVELQKDKEDIESFEREIDEINENYKEISLILLQLNLKNYVEINTISAQKIDEINKYFSIIRGTCI